MIEIYECTDCKNCACFHGGFRVYCLHSALPSDSVCDYKPVGKEDARECEGFEEGDCHEFSWKELDEAEKFSESKYQDVTYDGIVEWCYETIGFEWTCPRCGAKLSSRDTHCLCEFEGA